MDDDDAADHANYTNVHRALLQSLLSQQTLTFNTAKPLLAAIHTAASPDRETLPNDISQEDLDNHIHTLNASLSQFDFEIRSSLHQTTRERVYALVNTTEDALTQMATMHSAEEIAFVKRVLDAMFDTYNTRRAEVMAVTSMQALKLTKGDANRRESGNTQQGAAATTGLTAGQAERVLGHMVGEGWFERSERDFYSLTPRALMELRGWLVQTYNLEEDEEDEDEEDEEPHQKIKSCHACKEIVTVGQRCPNMVCEARLHKHCVRNMFRVQNGKEQCPKCDTAWVDAPPVGENASRGGGARRSTNGN